MNHVKVRLRITTEQHQTRQGIPRRQPASPGRHNIYSTLSRRSTTSRAASNLSVPKERQESQSINPKH
ncbi:hypothetical protein E2C01_087887 [Portunus trituberculatus]|uniref:Uncharacterized protein n=1 Tax=Portunus trituberculatus TaxID=210409 RepID=A0A5B7J4P9_PORTR|nr:hypothetical protein [Portunus trituberculatus]